jgi:SAM-dependent methyltransferase
MPNVHNWKLSYIWQIEVKMVRDELYEKEWIEFYDNFLPEKPYKVSFRKLLALIRKYNPAAKDVLELACGTGRYTRYFVKHGFRVKATDISKAAVEQAKARVPGAVFEVADMSKISEKEKFDIVACLFESFRYNSSYAMCARTLKKAYKALRPGGLFFCDFGVFPPTKKSDKAKLHHEASISSRRLVVDDETLYTKGDFDMRFDQVKVFKKRLFRTPLLLKEVELKRAPLLRISEGKMNKMLSKAGFQPLEILTSFRQTGARDTLFVAKKR